MYRAPAPENVLFAAMADHVTESAYVVGRVVVTPTALRFDSYVASGAYATTIPLAYITEIRPCRIVSRAWNGVEIVDHRGTTSRFLVKDPALWVRELEAILATHVRSDAYR